LALSSTSYSRRVAGRRLGLAGLMVVSVAMIVAMGNSYRHSANTLTGLGRTLVDTRPDSTVMAVNHPSAPRLLQNLNALIRMDSRLQQRLAAAPLLGNESMRRLSKAVSMAHRRSVQQTLVPLVGEQIEQQLNSPWNSAEVRAHTAQILRMLSGSESFDYPRFLAWARVRLTAHGSQVNTELAAHLKTAGTDWSKVGLIGK